MVISGGYSGLVFSFYSPNWRDWALSSTPKIPVPLGFRMQTCFCQFCEYVSFFKGKIRQESSSSTGKKNYRSVK